MYINLKVYILLGLWSVCSASSARRYRRDEVSLKDLFSGLIDSLLGDQKNATVNSTSLPSTFDWLKTLTSGSTHSTTNTQPSAIPSAPSSTVSANPNPGNSTAVNTPDAGNVTMNATQIPMFSLTSTESTVDERCGAEYTFTQLCGKTLPQLLVDLTIWDVYSVIFSNDVIEALLLNCNSGRWCLYDEFDYWNGLMMEKATMVKSSEIFSQICEATSCLNTFLQNVTGCPIEERMNFTVEALDLLCDMRKTNDVDLSCYGHLLATFHVTVVEFLRDSNNKALREGIYDGDCQTPEILMTRSFLCVEGKCPNQDANLKSFTPWQWFIPNIEQSKKQCDLSGDTCDDKAIFGPQATSAYTTEAFSTFTRTTTPTQVPNIPVLSGEQTGKEDGETNTSILSKMTLVLGVSAGGIIAISGFFVLVYACWRKHGYLRADKVGYTPLRNQD